MLADRPTDQAVRLVCGAGLTTRTVDVQARIFASARGSNYDNEAKVAAAEVLAEPVEPVVHQARLQAQGMPAPLLSAITELLVSGRRDARSRPTDDYLGLCVLRKPFAAVARPVSPAPNDPPPPAVWRVVWD